MVRYTTILTLDDRTNSIIHLWTDVDGTCAGRNVCLSTTSSLSIAGALPTKRATSFTTPLSISRSRRAATPGHPWIGPFMLDTFEYN